MEDFNWDEIKKELQKAVEIASNEEELSIKIIIKEPNIEQAQMVGDMLKSEDEMRQSLSAFINQNQPIDCDIEVNQEEKYISMKFKDKQMWNKTRNLFNDMFFGDYLKKMIEAMMGAFGGIFGKED
ncbi:MAG: hypothetical protein ACFFHV_19515 [Promethearchaeota archaeon]